MREIELKHARIAMVASIGWPTNELLRDSIFSRINSLFSDPRILYRPLFGPSALLFGQPLPPLPEGELRTVVHSHVTIASGELLWDADTGGFLLLASAYEYFVFRNRRALSRKRKEVYNSCIEIIMTNIIITQHYLTLLQPGDFGFDPLGLYELHGGSPAARRRMREGEIWNGRLAMCAVFAYFLIEKRSKLPIIEATVSIFHSLFPNYLS
jgi:hypothetical protein